MVWCPRGQGADLGSALWTHFPQCRAHEHRAGKPGSLPRPQLCRPRPVSLRVPLLRLATGLSSLPRNPRDSGTSPPRKGGVRSMREEKERVNRGRCPTGMDVCPVVWGVCAPERRVWPESSKRESLDHGGGGCWAPPVGGRVAWGEPRDGAGRAGKLAGRAGYVRGDGQPRQSVRGLCRGGRPAPPAARGGDQAWDPGQRRGLSRERALFRFCGNP